MPGLKKPDPDATAQCVLTVRLTFADRIDAEDAMDTVEHCITDAISLETSIEDI